MSKKTTEISEDELVKKIQEFQNALDNPDTTMTPEQLKELKEKVSMSLALDRQKLVTRQQFIGGMLMRFELIPIRDYSLHTAMTDGKRIYFDISFYKNLSDQERMFVLAHECWHCVYMHFLRKQSREAHLWNIATDCEINEMLKGEGFVPPPDLCFPEDDEKGKSAEEIYEILLKKAKKRNQSSDQEGNSSNQSNSSGGKGKSSGSGDPSGKKKGLTGQFDKHLAKGDDPESGNQKEGILPRDEWGEKGRDPDYQPHIDQDAAEKIREAVIAEAQKIERRQGTMPGGLASILEKLRKPEINWKELLATEITKMFTDSKVWLPPSRRHVHNDMYFQSRRGEIVKVKVVVDTSGSTTADLPKFMGETVALLNSFSDYEMEFIQCDAEVQSAQKYDNYNPFPVEDCKKIKFKGFGGSDFSPAFDHIAKDPEDIPNTVIFFTDGFITVPQNPPPYNVIWILTSDGNENLAPYGKKIRFRETRND